MPTFHNQMTKQEVFDALCEVSKAGGFPSMAAIGCAYRGDHGRACAIGLFLPDDLATKLDQGGVSAISSREVYEQCRPHLPAWMDKTAATRLQDAHDMSRASRTGWDHDRFVAHLTAALAFTPTESQS